MLILIAFEVLDCKSENIICKCVRYDTGNMKITETVRKPLFDKYTYTCEASSGPILTSGARFLGFIKPVCTKLMIKVPTPIPDITHPLTTPLELGSH